MLTERHKKAPNSSLQNGFDAITATLKPLKKEEPLPQQPAMGFFTDTSVCIGCKACEVACKQWNQLPATDPSWSGNSYDNTGQLGATTWRHVQFIEQVRRRPPRPERTNKPQRIVELPMLSQQISAAQATGEIPSTPPGTALPFFNSDRWLMHSDVCKHCHNAPCHEACPTGAIIRTEFDTVYVQQDICNGCGYCVVACPFGVIARDAEGDGQAHKCTLCYDRLKDDMQPACAKACPTRSIIFGPLDELKQEAQERVKTLQTRGVPEARLYGADDTIMEGGLHSFFLLLDTPETYNLPEHPPRPVASVRPASLWAIFTTVLLTIIGIICFQQKD